MDKYDIKEDNLDVEKAVSSAKFGNWSTVFDIIRKKPYLINCIPEQRTWAILHQAVYWNDLNVVTQLLDFPNCDALVKTKQCRNNDANPSSTPKEVAEQMRDRPAIYSKLNYHENNVRESRFSGKITHIVQRSEGEEVVDNLPLFMLAVINYRKTLLSPGTCPATHLVDLLKQIFKEEDHHWGGVKEKLHNAMYAVDKASADEFKSASSKTDFYGKIVHYYTTDYHRHVNVAVSRSFDKGLPATAEDLALALYDLLLDCVLMCWTNLQKINSVVYRGVSAKIDFKLGSEIMFTHFLSCSRSQEVAKRFAGQNGTFLKIDNATESSNRPKYLKLYSKYPFEEECLYGIGAAFRVVKVDNSQTYRQVDLELI